jgi:branched-chain amino acid transport system permease protein
VNGLSLGSLYALIALGYTLVYGVLRLINFAHSEVFMIGTASTLFATNLLGIAPADAAHTGFGLVLVLVACLVIAMAGGGATAVVLELVAYRPLRRRGATRLAFLISAIGASLFLSELLALPPLLGRDRQPVPELVSHAALVHLPQNASISADVLVTFFAALAMMVALDQFIRRSRLGRGIRAVAQDAETATLMGVNIDRVVSVTFLLGGLMAGAAGLLYEVRFPGTKFDVGFIYGIKAFAAAVLGGIGNLRGALLGGIVLGLLEAFGGAMFGAEWIDVIGFVILVVILLFRPTGLLGESIGRARA